jgi:N-acetylglutamate synthase-like GNAT family acetyltransferase
MKMNILKKTNKSLVVSFTNKYSTKKRGILEWDWEFGGSDANSNFIVVEDKGEIIGTQGLLPIKLIKNTQIFDTAKSEETLVHPDYRGKNIFNSMYDKLFENAEINGIKLRWGFTGACKPFTRAGFLFVKDGLRNYTFITSIWTAYKTYYSKNRKVTLKGLIKQIIVLLVYTYIKSRDLIRYKKKNKNFYIAEIEEFDLTTDKLKDYISKKQSDLITVDRNKDYMAWRISDNPFYRHKILGLYNKDLVGYAILSRSENSTEINIVDIMIKPEILHEGFPVLIEYIKKYSRIEHAGSINFQIMSSSNDYSLNIIEQIEKAGFFKLPGVLPFVLKILDEKLPSVFCNIEKWYINGLMTEGIAHRD